MPMEEMSVANQRFVYQTLGEYLFDLWEQDALPSEAIGLVCLEDGRSVALPFATDQMEDITEI